MDYFDILLAKKLEDDRDPKVEGLSVTQNGRYHEDGVVYDPVIVNVQPDLITKSITANGTYQASSDNADGYSSVDVHVSGYKITDVSGLPSAIATFSDGSALPMPKLEVAIEPVQEGSGDPSPTNIRPISGWSAVDVTVADDVDNPTVENIYTIDLDGTRYGGKVDLVSGVMTVTHGYLKLTDTDYNWQSGSWAGGYRYFTSNRITEALNNQTCQSSIYKKNAQLQEQGIAIDTAVNSNQIDVRTQHFSSLSSWKTYLASNPVDVRYELATPLTIQLTPTAVSSLLGQNNLWADTGDVVEASYWEEL